MAPGRRILVTGAQGFIGSRLVPFLHQLGHACTPAGFDVLDLAAAEAVLRDRPWDAVVHLAAISNVPACEKDPAQAVRANLGGTAVLLEAMRRQAPRTRLLFASTAQVYAAPHGDELRQRLVMDEERRIAPQNLYARTKWEAELLIADAALRDGLAATVVRLFNHTHKSQPPDFFLPHLYRSILEVRARGGAGPVPVGNLDVWRDIGSLQDLLRAFAALLGGDRAPAGLEIFNLCSGHAKHLSQVAEELKRGDEAPLP